MARLGVKNIVGEPHTKISYCYQPQGLRNRSVTNAAGSLNPEIPVGTGVPLPQRSLSHSSNLIFFIKSSCCTTTWVYQTYRVSTLSLVPNTILVFPVSYPPPTHIQRPSAVSFSTPYMSSGLDSTTSRRALTPGSPVPPSSHPQRADSSARPEQTL